MTSKTQTNLVNKITANDTDLLNSLPAEFRNNKDNESIVRFISESKAVMEEMNSADLNMVNTLINTKEKSTNVLKEQRLLAVDALITKEYTVQDDEKEIKKGKDAELRYSQLITVMIRKEKELFLAKEAAKKGVTVTELLGGANGDQLRTYLGETKGCPEANKAKKAYSNLASLRYKKAVEKGNISDTPENRALYLKSFRADQDGVIKALPVELRKDEDPDKNKKSDLQKALEAFSKLKGKDVTLFLDNICSNKSVAEKAIKQGTISLIEVEESEKEKGEDLESKIRVLENAIRDAEKGATHFTPKAIKNMKAELAKFKKESEAKTTA